MRFTEESMTLKETLKTLYTGIVIDRFAEGGQQPSTTKNKINYSTFKEVLYRSFVC